MSVIVERPLTDLLEEIIDNRGRSCPVADSGFPLIATNCVKFDHLNPVFENIRYVDQETCRTWFRGHPKPDDIIFVCKGSPGRVAVVPDPVPFCIAQDMVALRAASEVVYHRYLYYALKSPRVQSKILSMHVGTMIPHFKKGDFGKLALGIHQELNEQRAIAEVLGALDAKIAANTKLASNADAWVRTVLADVASEAQGKITLGRLVTLVRDLVEPALLPIDTVYVGLEHIPRRFMWLDSCGTTASITSTKSRFDAGDILFGKLRPYFHKVVSAPMGGVCSTDVLVIRPVDEKMAGFVLAAIASDEVVQRCTAATEGTRMPRTSWKDLATAEVVWPGDATAFALSEKISSLRDAVEARLRENGMLVATRDALLPPLMSGKIRVKDAEKTVEEVL